MPPLRPCRQCAQCAHHAAATLWGWCWLTLAFTLDRDRWGMLPLHASGVAACTYHFFFNNPDLAFLVTLHAARVHKERR